MGAGTPFHETGNDISVGLLHEHGLLPHSPSPIRRTRERSCSRGHHFLDPNKDSGSTRPRGSSSQSACFIGDTEPWPWALNSAGFLVAVGTRRLLQFGIYFRQTMIHVFGFNYIEESEQISILRSARHISMSPAATSCLGDYKSRRAPVLFTHGTSNPFSSSGKSEAISIVYSPLMSVLFPDVVVADVHDARRPASRGV